MRRAALLLILSCVALVPGLEAQSRPAPEALARTLQQRYQQVRDFSASFVHSYRGGVLRTLSSERGTVSVKKPGKMRWIYTNPERKEIVSDGAKIYTHIVADKQVIVSDVPSTNTSAALFLSGQGDLVRDFTAEYADTAPAGTTALKLTPRRPQPEFEYLVLAVDPATLQMRVLTTRDHQGGDSTITFSDMKENAGLADKEFVFRVPRGVDVITDGPR
jgi:outer membrane lipoprotein carrier protein